MGENDRSKLTPRDSEQAQSGDTLPTMPFVRLMTVPEVKAINRNTREVLHIITNATEDRAGDVVDPAGADVTNYMKNPVVLADHNYSINSIIGRATSLEIRDGGLWARTKFHDKGIGADAFNLVEAGMARAWSIGFRPVEYDTRKDKDGRKTRGFHFKKWELLEYSLVAIPMNPDIVANAIKRGLLDPDNVPNLFDGVLPAPEPEATPAEAAGDGPNVTQRDYGLYDEHIKRALRTLERHNKARAIKRVFGQ
jgi:HK97 family phage prohead protease